MADAEDDVQVVMLSENEWKILSILRAQGYWIIVLLVVIAVELLLVIGR